LDAQGARVDRSALDLKRAAAGESKLGSRLWRAIRPPAKSRASCGNRSAPSCSSVVAYRESAAARLRPLLRGTSVAG